MRFLCVFAMPRTGSSHVNKLLKSCDEFNAKSELFHRRTVGVFTKPELMQLQKRADIDVKDHKALTDWRRRHPLETLEALYQGGGRRIVTFKTFPGHLEKELLEDELFPRDDVAFAILRRRPIESFISGLKARSVSTFGRVDTTAIKPELSAERFVVWARKMKNWYAYTRKKLEARGKPYAFISFERHIDGQSGEESLGHILALLEPLGIADIAVPEEVKEGERQDREPVYQERVSNWEAFVDEVNADPVAAKLFKWAQRES